ncbi:hypothetical protein APHAL10511_003467 [Amanita phalloides]|nr:hypothetical protein APHAL10511_003467 [Amanita phalloides]
MPWDTVKLNDGGSFNVKIVKHPTPFLILGTSIPGIGFGTWKIPNNLAAGQVDQAISLGFNHIDTAPVYWNEEETGKAIRESGLSRSEIYITTKFSGFISKSSSSTPDYPRVDIHTSINNSLKNLGVSYIDLYLIHFPDAAVPDIPTVWRQMEEIQVKGLAKSIGVSNFSVHHLETLLASAKVHPAVNQIELHPYIYARNKPILDHAAKYNIVIEAYSPLRPITQRPGGPLDKPLREIASRLQATDDQVLLAWIKAKGAVAVTTSSKTYRLEGYLRAGDLELEDGDIAALEKAGSKDFP